MHNLTIVLGNYPHTKAIKSQTTIAGIDVVVPEIAPVHEAFDDMVRTQCYDVCEMAMGAFLQAIEAGKPLVLLPAVMLGRFHHDSIVASPVEPPSSPAAIRGQRVGVRSYSQTTGLWVRAILAEEYGVTWSDVTWVTTEGSHADGYHDPDNVVRTDASLKDELRSGGIVAAILGDQADPDMVPLIADPVGDARRWYERTGVIPVNHLVCVTPGLVEEYPTVVREVYSHLTAGIDDAVASGTVPRTEGLPTAIRHGRDAVRQATAMAAEAAFEQSLITRRVPDIDQLFAF